MANIGEYFRQHISAPDKVLYRHFDGGEWRDVTVGEIAAQAGRWQTALAVLGLVPGDRVAICLKNGVDWVALDLAAKSWNGLPDLGTARHGLAVAAVGKTVYAIGGSTGVGDEQVTSSGEGLKLAPRKPQPAPQWRSLPDAPTATVDHLGARLVSSSVGLPR